MKFEYSIINDQLYLNPSEQEEDFSFLGIGLCQSSSKNKKHISQILHEISDTEKALKLLELEASRYPNSSLYDVLTDINEDFTLHPTGELIFFGGSFNPWHAGHKACLDLLGDKKCIILPDRNPFKEIHNRPPLESYLELISHINLDHHYVNPEFILKNEKNPTYNWMKRTHERSPHTKLGLLMGMDSLETIERWHRADELLQLLSKIYVVSRLENELLREDLKERLARYTHLQLHYLGHHPFESLSSTQLREEK